MKPSRGAPEQYHNETPAAIAQRQRGVTGMETAIILLAFVVVASIYAFAVLSTGIVSVDKGKETVRAGFSEPSGPIRLEGSAVGEGSPDIALPLDETIRPAVATSSIGYQAGLTADTVDKNEDSASTNIAPSATSTIDIMAPRTSPPLSLIVDRDSLQLWTKYGLA